MTRRASRQKAALIEIPKKRASTGTTSSHKSKHTRTSIGLATSPRSTPKKSKYFSKSDVEETEDPEESSNADLSESDYKDEERNSDVSETSKVSDDVSDFSDTRPTPRKKKLSVKKSPTVLSQPTTIRNKDLWRAGVKAGLGPGNAVRIKLPKAREPGSTPYTDNTIHQNTFLFLKDLKANNDREWLKMHDADYRTSKKDWDTFVGCLTEQIIERDETIPELPVKDLTFRIYRDIRFSSDPTPYKPHFSAAWSRTGRKGPYAGYYVQISPNTSFVGGGLWMPEAGSLAVLRRNIDRKASKIKEVLTDARIRKEYFGGIPDDEQKAVTVFCSQNTENALKTKPKGYGADHPNIALLRLRNFTIGRKLKDTEVLGTGGLARIADLIEVLVPFITYLNSVVMPDDPSDSSDSDQGSPQSDEESE